MIQLPFSSAGFIGSVLTFCFSLFDSCLIVFFPFFSIFFITGALVFDKELLFCIASLTDSFATELALLVKDFGFSFEAPVAEDKLCASSSSGT
ncbi:hypothetical protein Hanom_Chr09g00839421 [Helianthus anomalus]